MSTLQKTSGCKFVEKCVFRHEKVDSQSDKKPKKTGGKGSVVLLKNPKQRGCVFQDVEPPKSKSILRTHKILGTKAQGAILKKAHHATSKFGKERVPSKCVMQHFDPHERSPCAPKFEHRSEEETLKQARAMRRRVAWEIVISIHKLKEKDKAIFHSPSEVWCFPSSTKPEER